MYYIIISYRVDIARLYSENRLCILSGRYAVWFTLGEDVCKIAFCAMQTNAH